MADRFKTLSEAGLGTIPEGRSIYRSTCPRCSQGRKYSPKQKCLTVWPNGNDTAKVNWHCNHCEWQGFIPRIEREEVKPLKDKTVDISDSESAINWFIKRGINEACFRRSKVSFSRNQTTKEGRIAFRYFQNGQLKNIKYRSKDKRFNLLEGGKLVFYGIDDIENAETVIICEGEIDKLSFDMAGYTNSVSVPNGAPPENAQVVRMDYLDSCIDYFDPETVTKIILACDNDGAGQRLSDEFVRRLGSSRCYRVEFPEGCKDANDVLLKYGIDGIHDLVNGAKPEPCPNIYEDEYLQDSLLDLYENGYPDGCKTGLKELDSLFKWYTPALTVVTGIPGMGKSTFVDMCCILLAQNEGWKFVVYSPENYPVTSHLKRLTEQHSGMQMVGERKMSRENFDKSSGFVRKHFIFMNPDANGTHLLKTMMDVTELQVQRNGINCLIIDPWNMVEHDSGNEPETQYVQRVLKELKSFARKVNIMIIVVAHPRKPPTSIDGVPKPPSLYDIAGSSNWYNMVDNGFVIHTTRDGTDDESKYTIVYVKKVKHTYMGRTGDCKLSFDRGSQRYSDYKNGSSYVGSDSYSVKLDLEDEDLKVRDSEWADLPF